MNLKEKLPLIFWVLLFIPVVGMFVGIIFFIYGIFKRKSYIIPGLVGIAFTGLIGFLFNKFIRSEKVSKGFESIAQIQINTLCNSIELYKIKSGNYPDSLSSIADMDQTVILSDPMLSGVSDVNEGYFYYEKRGNHYILFSVGSDKVPFTNDDIYPEISDTDNLKLGLIKR